MNCCRHKYFVIYRGDDTDFPGNQELIVELNTERDLTGCSAHFSFQGFTQDFAEIPSDKKLHLIFPSSETKKFALGAADAKLWLTYGSGTDEKTRTVENRIHIVVTNRVDEAYDNDDPQAITVTISGGGGGATVVLDNTVTEESPNGVKSSGIWSWVKSLLPQWLTSDYTEPATVASVKLKADKATTLSGYGITDAVPLVEDASGEKTAVTIGSRKDGERVGEYSFANGGSVTASVPHSHAEGGDTTASGAYSHAEGVTTTASGHNSHSEGNGTTASGMNSHAEGESTTAAGPASHAEGGLTTASGDYSHAEGNGTTASGMNSHAEGESTTAAGPGSHAEGIVSKTREEDRYAFAWNGDDTRISSYIPYASHGPGTFNINPVGGLEGFYIGDQKLTQVINTAIAGKANLASLALEYSVTSAYSVGAIVYHDGNIYQCKTAIADGGETWNVEHWELRKLDDFFTNSNSLLTGTIDARLPYPLYAVPSTGLLKDRAINTTSLASVTVPDNFTDLLVRASVASSLSVTMPEAIATKYGDTFPGEAGEYLITITKTDAAEAYVRTIKLEEVA